MKAEKQQRCDIFHRGRVRWFENEMAENFRKNIGTLRCEEARSCHSNYNFRQKLVFLKLISTSPGEHFQFFKKNLEL